MVEQRAVLKDVLLSSGAGSSPATATIWRCNRYAMYETIIHLKQFDYERENQGMDEQE